MATTGIFNGSQYTVMFETDGTTPVVADHVTDLSVSVSTEPRFVAWFENIDCQLHCVLRW